MKIIRNGVENLNVVLTGSNGTEVAVNDDNQLHVVMAGKVDDLNSTSTAMSANATFTGSAVDTLEYAVLQLMVRSNVASSTDGLSVQFSADGTNWDSTDDYTVPANAGKVFSFQPAAKFYRVLYTNGASNQTMFRLQSILKKTYVKPSSHRIKDAIISDDDAELVKAVITGENPGGNFVTFQSTTAGNFKISLEELESGISSNTNSQLNTTSFHADGTEGNILSALDYTSGKSGIDASTESLQTIDYSHHEVHEGDHYYIEGFTELGVAGTLYIKLVTPDNTKWSHFLWDIGSSGILTTTLVEGVTGGLAGGSGVTIFNSNRNSANTSGNVITSGVTAPTGGVIISQTSFGNRNAGGSQAREAEIILKQNTTYGRTFLSGTASNIINFRASWYEHTAKN